MRTRVKVCCIAATAEIDMAVKHGVDALGFVGPMPSGPGVLDLETIAGLIQHVPPGVGSFFLTSETTAAGVLAQQQVVQANTLQLTDWLPHEERMALRKALPAIRLVQVIHVQGPESVAEAMEAAKDVHGLLLDSGQPNAETKTLGGTGLVHNWTHSQQIVAQSPVPVFLAGGLHPGNAANAIAQVAPYGLDICSKIRDAQYRLKESLLTDFLQAIAKADATRE